MKDTVKISFVIPVYNVASYVERCIRSILNQTLQDIEIICVEDVSSDNSLAVIREIAREDNRIRIFQNRRNRGLSYSRNKGMQKAQGEYIWFVDSDDWIMDPDAASILYQRAKEKKCSILLFDPDCKYENEKLHKKLGDFQRKYPSDYSKECSGTEMFTRQMLAGDYMSTVWIYLFDRNWLINSGIRFVEGLLHEDMLFTIETLLLADRVGYIPQKLYGYFRRENSITSSENNACRKVSGFAYVMGELYFRIRNNSFNEKEAEAIVRYMLAMKRALADQYLVCIRNDEEIPYFRSSDQLIVKMILEEKFPLIYNTITHDFYSRVKQSELLIVYGAGYVSEITCNLLTRIEINDYVIAVTKGKTESVHELSEYKAKKALVLIAATGEKQQEMINHAVSLGLCDYICMV